MRKYPETQLTREDAAALGTKWYSHCLSCGAKTDGYLMCRQCHETPIFTEYAGSLHNAEGYWGVHDPMYTAFKRQWPQLQRASAVDYDRCDVCLHPSAGVSPCLMCLFVDDLSEVDCAMCKKKAYHRRARVLAKEPLLCIACAVARELQK